jgi:hypothetical protein
MIRDTLAGKDRHVFLVGLRPNVYQFLHRQGVLEKVDSSHIYPQRHPALCHAARLLQIDTTGCEPV